MKKRLISFMLLITVISCVGFNTDYFKNLLTLISQAAKEVIYEETESYDEETSDSAVDRLEQELQKLDVRNFFEDESETESNSNAELKTKAEKAIQELITTTPGGNTKSMAVAAYDLKTGKIVAGFAGPVPDEISSVLIERANKIGGIGSLGVTDRNTVGVCAEFRTVNQLLLGGSDISNIRLTEAIRPRTGKVRPYCDNCMEIFFDILGK